MDGINAWPLVYDVLVDPVLTPDKMRRICADLEEELPALSPLVN